MERRTALTIAGAVALSLTAATAAAANVGILGSGEDGLGEMDAQTIAELVDTSPAPATAEATSPESTVVYVDEYVTAPAGPSRGSSGATTSANDGTLEPPGAGGAIATDPGAAPSIAPVPDRAPAPPGDDHDEVDHEDDDHEDVDHEDDDHDEVEHEDDDHDEVEHEGEEDDD